MVGTAELELVPESNIEKLNQAKKILKTEIDKKNIRLGAVIRELSEAQEEQKKALNDAKKKQIIGSQLAMENAKLLQVNSVLQQAEQILSDETSASLKEVNQQLGVFLDSQPVDMKVEVLENFSLRITNVDGFQ